MFNALIYDIAWEYYIMCMYMQKPEKRMRENERDVSQLNRCKEKENGRERRAEKR